MNAIQKEGVSNISIIKKAVVNIRHSFRFFIWISIAVLIIIGILATFYKKAYIVNYNGQFIGYCTSKTKLQEKINAYIENGNSDTQNLAYVDIDVLPTYSLTFLKKNIQTNEDEIYKTVISSGITYYKYFAIQLNDEDKYFVSKYAEAEEVLQKLKDKNSSNIDKVKIVERYDTNLASFTAIDDCVSNLYEQKKTTKKYSSSSSSSKAQYVPSLGINMIEPVQGIITSRFGIRKRDNHKGIDIANSTGTTICAAAAGTVTYAQYNSGGYGNLVIISHGNGIQTYYGHNSKLYVTVGQTVAQGEAIAAMGSTGISTGPHCHFEIRINGVAQNPQNYLFKGR